MAATKTFPALSIILGGASSGKSAFAEQMATAASRPRVYIATAQAFDVEMTSKIAKHQEDRGPNWQTIEAPLDLISALHEAPSEGVILIDCLTLWLSNHLLAESDLEAEITNLTSALGDTTAPVICVSNEVGMGLVPDNKMGRRFRDVQGLLNKQIAKKADVAVFVTAGLPLTLKGGLPEGIL